MRYTALLLLLTAAACTGDTRRAARQFGVADSGIPTPPPPPFEAPDSWDTVRLASGVSFRQPGGFTFGLSGARLSCDANTPPADSAVLPREVALPFPMTLTTRKGLVGPIAYANGFTIDSTDIAEHGGAEAPSIRRGEGWLLLHGKRMVFGASRHPDGCQIIWAARGVEINPDTLALVMGTVRFGAPAP